MSWTLPPNGDIGRIDIDWLSTRMENITAVNKLYVLLHKLEPRRFPFGGMVDSNLQMAQKYYSRP